MTLYQNLLVEGSSYTITMITIMTIALTTSTASPPPPGPGSEGGETALVLGPDAGQHPTQRQ